jgi:hypothetical protein
MTLKKAGDYILRRFEDDYDDSEDSSMLDSE